jgi:diaminohydroxyphosphoribosylaminopyrimidine deaminase/5-amino-6-(5-phosphoribosylamino)uracil reductase
VIVNDGETVGWGYHRHVGGPHAEIVALQRAGARAKGATVYCTLEPCNHQGRTGPCAEALIDAGVARVLVARRDPWTIAAGGIERLRAAAIDARWVDNCTFAAGVNEPFAYRLATGLPWVTVKWAQTRDGAIAFGQSSGRRWVSNEASRAMVHRERGRVDAILTGIGTVLADDPMLTPRHVRLRRLARRPPTGLPLRMVVDPHLRTPLSSQLACTAREVPTIIACAEQSAKSEVATRLRTCGVELMALPMDGAELPLATALKRLVSQHDVAHVLTEAGPGLMRRLFGQRLANEAWVFTAPVDTGLDPSLPHVRGMLNHLRIETWAQQRRGDDVIARSLVHYPPV